MFHCSLNSQFHLCLHLKKKDAPPRQCKYVCVCLSLIVTISAGVSGPAVCADAGESHWVFHTSGSVHTWGRQTRMFH